MRGDGLLEPLEPAERDADPVEGVGLGGLVSGLAGGPQGEGGQLERVVDAAPQVQALARGRPRPDPPGGRAP